MDPNVLFLFAADSVLAVHFAFVAFVVIGLLLIVSGGVFGWEWVRNRWFRIGHLIAIGIVVLQSWFGMICPLTIWEMTLRSRAGDTTYAGSFISHWTRTLLYYDAPTWLFACVYTAFGLAVLACWVWIRPLPFGPRPG